MEDRELVPLVLEEPRLGIEVELEAVGGGSGVSAWQVALGRPVTEGDEAARLVGGLGVRVLGELYPDLLRNYQMAHIRLKFEALSFRLTVMVGGIGEAHPVQASAQQGSRDHSAVARLEALPRGDVVPEGSFVLNIKDRVVNGERHPYVLELVLALRQIGWKWIDTYIWVKPNAIPGRFGPRAKDAWEYVYWFAKGRPYFDLDAIRVPYRTPPEERARRALDPSPRRNTAAGHGRKRAQTYERGGADPGNVITASLTYNQHYGVAHTAAMPELLAEFVIKAGAPPGAIVVDPFAGSGTTSFVARRFGRRAGGLELHREHVEEAVKRLSRSTTPDLEGERHTPQLRLEVA